MPPPAIEAPVRARLGVSALFVVGTAAYPSGALAALGGLAWGAFSFEADVRVELPIEGRSEAGDFTTWLFTFGATPCGHLDMWVLCGAVRGGALRAFGRGVADATEVTTPWIALGIRAGLEIPVGEPVRFTVWAELDGVLTQTELLIGAARAYSSSPVAAAIQAGVVWEP